MKITHENLSFAAAFLALEDGRKIKLPEWEGYWYRRNDEVVVRLKDGTESLDPWFKETCFRKDWQVVDVPVSLNELV